jgi:ArsR family transcriptional regulator
MKRQRAERPGKSTDLAPVAEFFQLLADSARLGILVLLAQGERNVSSLGDELSVPPPTLSHHLKLLLAAGMIAKRPSGRLVYYRLAGRALADPGVGRLRMSGDHCGIEIRLGSR